MVASETSLHRARVLIVALCILGIVLSFVSLQHHVQYVYGFASGPSFCHINAHFNCEAVNASEWSSFLGVPIASYGLFFYTTILIGALAAKRTGGILSLSVWSSIVCGLSILASLISLALLGISEFLIGAICLLCLGTYLVNFAILGVVWGYGWRGNLWMGARAGVANTARLLMLALGLGKDEERRGAWLVRFLSLLVILSAGVSAALPAVMVSMLSQRDQDGVDPIAQWRSSPLIAFELETKGGAFGDYSKGDPAAPIQIVEFADYECPACKRMFRDMKQLLERYEGSYFFVFKNYPLDRACNPNMTHDLHEFACTAAVFSRCAGEQGKFWEAMEVLFLREADKGELSHEDLLVNGSRELSLDEEAMRECLVSGRYKDRILKDIEAGTRAGLQATPSIWVNGKFVPNASPALLEGIFDSILGKRTSELR